MPVKKNTCFLYCLITIKCSLGYWRIMKAFLSICSLNKGCKVFFLPHKTQEIWKKEKKEKTRKTKPGTERNISEWGRPKENRRKTEEGENIKEKGETEGREIILGFSQFYSIDVSLHIFVFRWLVGKHKNRAEYKTCYRENLKWFWLCIVVNMWK